MGKRKWVIYILKNNFGKIKVIAILSSFFRFYN